MNSLAITKLIRPQPGKVNTQVSIMSLTTPKLMALRTLDGTHAHDGAGLGVGGGNRDAEQAGEQQAERAGKVGGKALVFFQLDHVHAHGLDDLFTADAGAHAHHGAAQKHQPHGDDHAGHAVQGRC